MRLLSGGRRATGGIREREAKLEARKRREEQVWKKMKTKPGDGRSIWALNLTDMQLSHWLLLHQRTTHSGTAEHPGQCVNANLSMCCPLLCLPG